MSYAHFWYRPLILDRERFILAVEDCRRICDALPIPLAGWNGRNKSKFSQSEVCFNGCIHSIGFGRDGDEITYPSEGANSVSPLGESVKNGRCIFGQTVSSRCVDLNGDGSYDTFQIKRVLKKKQVFEPEKNVQLESCQTNYRPYDLPVQCCLIIFNHFFGKQFRIHSFGADEQWYEAANDCQAVLGYGLEFVLDE